MIKKTEREKYISSQEFAALLKAARIDVFAYMLFYLIGNLGLRVGEGVRLRKEDIDCVEGYINCPTLKQGTKKGVKNKSIKQGELPKIYKQLPISKVMCDKVVQYCKGMRYKTWLFPDKNNLHVPEWKVQRWFKKYAAIAKLNPHYSVHALRHYKGTETYKKFKDIMAVKEVLRHKSISSSQIYIGMDLEDKRKIMSALKEVE